ncbi:LppU/SCO3897 family protein [Actinokineospora bangkokensis]|uniref:Uncharacterized protein n=1 Tax=Actinokineospora bangkokensis TaxID=1193682 RepID=A0A1Q9LCW0_9PSEU|nr:hypothetical protein [Actinokineospora bangkokensis]OLR89852.1 hypothetical protein BJP25_02195 [Actinokineospora bangkokensis]
MSNPQQPQDPPTPPIGLELPVRLAEVDEEPVVDPARRKRLALVAGVVAAVALVAFFGLRPVLFGAAGAEPGDCVVVTSVSDADVDPLDCADPRAVFQVAERLDSSAATCPRGNYVRYAEGGRSSDFSLCLVLNTRVGDCFTDLAGPSDRIARVDCAGAAVRVTAVVDGDPAADCAEGGEPVQFYTAPPRTICGAKP